MIEKAFFLNDGYLHIPIKSRDENGITVDIIADGELYAQYYVPIAKNSDERDFYAYLDLTAYKCKEVRLVSENCDNSVFDGVIAGDAPENEPTLYPELYNENVRQKIHYSPKRGWVNDPNGLFYKDGVFNLYYQHNPLDNLSYGADISWGHAISVNGLNFTELPEAIVPDDANYIVASGSALVDQYNIACLSKDAIIGAYTKLLGGRCLSLHPEIVEGEGQVVVYSLDGGITFKKMTGSVTIPAPPKTYWRDPKLIQIDEKTIAMAVYETYDGQNCVSFYKTNDCRNWKFCSRNMDLYECPDLFCLETVETGEKLWVLYGGNGKYRVGNFESFVFTPNGGEGFLDYGDSVYAGQTYNNFDDDYRRFFTAWLREDTERDVFDKENRRYGFSQSMNLMTELSIHKTDDGYRVFRKPIAEIEKLRKTTTASKLNGEVFATYPAEIEFTAEKDFKIVADKELLCYNAEKRTIFGANDKSYTLSGINDLSIRIITDTNSVEIFIADEIVLSYYCDMTKNNIKILSDSNISGKVYELCSIWKG